MDPSVCWKRYPKQYEEWIVTRDEESVFLRPIKPSDGPLIEDLFSKLSPPSIYFRFLSNLDRLRPEILYHLVHLDYECEFALAATIWEKGRDTIIGVCRYACTLDPQRAELTVVIRDDWQGKGIGRALVERVFKIARKNGILTLELRIDAQNESSINLFTSMGYPYIHSKAIMWEPYDLLEIELEHDSSENKNATRNDLTKMVL
jgi:acetyltransferase